MTTRVVNISACARCEGDHTGVPSQEFARPIELGGLTWGWWGVCPETNEPILMTDQAESEMFGKQLEANPSRAVEVDRITPNEDLID